MSLRGYWRTLSDRMDCSPAMRMTRLTTMASTGRRTKRSVSFIIDPPPLSPPVWSSTPHPIPPHVGGGERLWRTDLPRVPRAAGCRLSTFDSRSSALSVVLQRRLGVVGGLDVVVHLDRG